MSPLPVLSPLRPVSISCLPDPDPDTPAGPEADGSGDHQTSPAAAHLKFTLEELVADGDQADGDRAEHELKDPPAAGQTGGPTEVVNVESPAHSASGQSEEGEFSGFIESELKERVLSEEMFSQRQQHHDPEGSHHVQGRRPRRRRYPKIKISYNLRRSQGMNRKSYRQTRTRRKKGGESPNKKGSAADPVALSEVSGDRQDRVEGQVASAGQAAAKDEEEKEEEGVVVYTVPLQYRLVDAPTALELLRGRPPTELSADALEEAALDCPVVPDPDAAGRDLLETLRQTVQDELDLLGYPPARSCRRSRMSLLKAMSDIMLEEEWQAWRRLMPPRRGRPRKFPRPDDLSWILQMKQVRFTRFNDYLG